MLVVVVVLDLPANKAIEDEDDDDENGKMREFPDRACGRGRRRARSAGE